MPKTAAPAAPTKPRRHRIEYEPLGKVKKWPKNPKQHDLAGLGDAFRDRGFVTPPIKDEQTGQLVEGHGRIEKLEAMKAGGEPAPDGIEVRDDGEWYVPIVRGIRFADLDQARRHLLAANRLGEAGGWDNALVADMLGKLGKTTADFIGTGFSADDYHHFVTMAKGWTSDLDAVSKHGENTDGIAATIRVTCPQRAKDKTTAAIQRAIKGIRGAQIVE